MSFKLAGGYSETGKARFSQRQPYSFFREGKNERSQQLTTQDCLGGRKRGWGGDRDIKADVFLRVLMPENKFSNVRWDAVLGGDFCIIGLSFVKQYKVLCV